MQTPSPQSSPADLSASLSVCLLEPFYGGSHRRWAEELKRFSRHRIEILSLPDRHWKWRMHGAAITLAHQFLAAGQPCDLILATDMMDLALFRAMAGQSPEPLPPIALYFHENQLCYPWSPRDKDPPRGRDLHYSFINYTSALAADRVYFNSDYHRRAFLEALPAFLQRYPDHRNLDTIGAIEAKSSTLPLALDLSAFDAVAPSPNASHKPRPLLLWNHRWEYDKNPIGFFRLLYQTLDKGLDFDLALLGERFRSEPPYFRQAKERLGRRIVQYGAVNRFKDYARWLRQADILLVTAQQDFFGGSVVEAIYGGCHPILPKRLAYTDHFEPAAYPDLFYETEDEALSLLAGLMQSERWRAPFTHARQMARYDWRRAIPNYDRQLALASRQSDGAP